MMRRGLLLVFFALGGCDLRAFTVNTTAPVLRVAHDSFAAETDLQLAREAAPATLKTAEGFLANAPNNTELLLTLAEGCVEYAFGFLEDDLEALPDDTKHQAERENVTARATGLYDRAEGYALRLLAQEDKHFPETFKKDAASVEAAAKRFDKDEAGGLLFTGVALASAININRNDLARVVDLPKAIAVIKRSHELDPKFYNAGAAMFLGVFYSAQGKAIGGDPEKGKGYFEEAIKLTDGKFLLPKVMLARFYAVTAQNRPLFESTLKEVLATADNVWPEQTLPNKVAKKRAARYLAHVEDYF